MVETALEKMPVFEAQLHSAKDTFLTMADEKTWISEMEFAMQTIKNNKTLQTVDPTSIRNAIVNVAMTGTTLNPAMAQAYLVPRDGKCCLDFSFRGLLKIATDAGTVISVQANVVYDFDEFDYEEGTNQHIHFKRSLKPPDDFLKDPTGTFWKHLVCVFSIATLHDGSKDYMILPSHYIEKVKRSSKAKSEFAPWQTWPAEMARKTVIKYHYKTLPQTDRMSNAVNILNEHEGLDLEKEPTNAQKLNDRLKKTKDPVDAATDITPGNDKDKGSTGTSEGNPPEIQDVDEDLYRELEKGLRDAKSEDDLAGAWAIVQKQGDNLTTEQLSLLTTLKNSLKLKLKGDKPSG